MTEKLEKFGELSSIDDNLHGTNQFTNGFSTIDLNAGVQTPDSSYTSFGETINHFSYNQTNSSQLELTNNNSTNNPTTTSSTSFGSTFNPLNSSPSVSMISSTSDASSRLSSRSILTFETLKQWGKSAYKCTRQIVSEKLGKSRRTIDPELDLIIENIRENRRKYDQLLFLSRAMAHHFLNLVTTQKMLSDSFSTLAQKSPELMDEFSSNCELQRSLVRNGETLLSSINSFTSNLNTLCNKTMEDTLLTVRNYEGARLEYDAYRFDMELLQNSAHTDQQVQELEKDVQIYKEKYEKLKNDVLIKTKFLDENRIKVMHKQLILFQNAISVYYSNNMVQAKMCQSPTNSEDIPNYKSFLEKD